MSCEISEPTHCRTMTEVRRGVDQTDRDLVALLARRFDYMRAAARIKPDRSEVRDEARKAEVIRNAAELAGSYELPETVIKDIWEVLVEGSIAYEFEQWERLRD